MTTISCAELDAHGRPNPEQMGNDKLDLLTPVYQVRLQRIDTLRVREKVSTPRCINTMLSQYLQDVTVEHFVAVLLDTKMVVIGIVTISIGDLTSSIVHPREVFKCAIAANAMAIIVAHNHPSGDPTPSPEDIAITRRLSEAGELLGIELLDHIIMGDGTGRFLSLKEKGLM